MAHYRGSEEYMAPATEELMDLQAAAKFMGCSTMTTRRMAKRGDLPVVKLPGTRLLRFRPSTLQRVIETSEKGKGGAA
jgi:excisionase family DNA binding protein